MKKVILAIFLLSLLLLTGCSKKNEANNGGIKNENNKIIEPIKDNNYFPVKIGNSWKYSLALPGASIYEQITDFAKEGSSIIYRVDVTSYYNGEIINKYNYALMIDNNLIVKIQNVQGVTLKESLLILPVKIGDTWGNEDTFLVENAGWVKVPSGTFDNCIKVKAIYNNTLMPKGTQYIYYAPNIGKIKNTMIDEGNIERSINELIDYDIKK